VIFDTGQRNDRFSGSEFGGYIELSSLVAAVWNSAQSVKMDQDNLILE
jgi:hypothetical protein